MVCCILMDHSTEYEWSMVLFSCGAKLDPSSSLSEASHRQVHEYWAQVALEFGDFKQFDQAAAQLEARTVPSCSLKVLNSTWKIP